MNKYKKWYNNIIAKGLEPRAGYTERHHILPKSLGGSDEPSNLVELTAREHFICHWLLTKIYNEGEDHWKMLNALRMMRAENSKHKRYDTKITARVYENLKEEYSALQSVKHTGKGNGFFGKNHTAEAKKRISAANKGRVQTQEEKERQIAAMTGRKREPFSDEWKAKLKETRQGERNGMYGKTHSDETKQKQREKAIGRKQSAETVLKKAAANKGKIREKKLCPYCNQEIAVNTYSRWHGDNCKHKP